MTDFAAAITYLRSHGWTDDTQVPDAIVNGPLRIYWGSDEHGPYVGYEGDPAEGFEVHRDRAVDILAGLDLLPVTMSSAHRAGLQEAWQSAGVGRQVAEVPA